MSLSTFFIGIPLAVVAVTFAVSNRQSAEISLWPFPYELEMPLCAALLAIAVIAFILGGFLAWLSGGKVRRENRKRGKRIRELEKTLAAQKTDEESS